MGCATHGMDIAEAVVHCDSGKQPGIVNEGLQVVDALDQDAAIVQSNLRGILYCILALCAKHVRALVESQFSQYLGKNIAGYLFAATSTAHCMPAYSLLRVFVCQAGLQ